MTIFDSFRTFLKFDLDRIADRTTNLYLPIFKEQDIITLCNNVQKNFSNEKIVIQIEYPCTIIGDLHGHLLDLIRIFQKIGLPEKQKVVFLGDYIDRGEFSLETLLFIYALKLEYPSNVLIIRGNHEFESVCNQLKFSTEINNLYPDSKLFHVFIESFAYMPLAVLIGNSTLCIHGGLGPDIQTISDIEKISRPLNSFQGISQSILWSDPSNDIPNYSPSNRGSGFLFGSISTQQFLNRNNLIRIIRAHEFNSDGFKFFFDQKLISIFSASNYCGEFKNESSILNLSEDNLSFINFTPFPFLKRSFVFFQNDILLPLNNNGRNTRSSSLISSNEKRRASYAPNLKSFNSLKNLSLFPNIIENNQPKKNQNNCFPRPKLRKDLSFD